MNKVFKVVWSKAKNCYVVASELAKNHTKSSSNSAKKLLALSVLATVISCGAVMPFAEAAQTNMERTTVGDDVYSTVTDGAVVGNDSHSLAIGDGSTIMNPNSNEIAIGHATFANNSSIAMGGRYDDQEWKIQGMGDRTFGTTAEGNGDIVLGSASHATGDYTIIMGTSIISDANNAVIIGRGANSSADSAVAIGANSQATEYRTVSVGNDTIKRRIVNVANGTADNDVSTVGQMKSTVNNEATARQNADTALSNRIGTINNDGNFIKKSATNNVSQNLIALDNQIKNVMDSTADMLDDKADIDAGNVAQYDQEWADAIGTGKVAADDTHLVTGKAVYDALHDPNATIEVKEIKTSKIEAGEGEFDNIKTKNLEVTNLTELNRVNVNGVTHFKDNVYMEKDLQVDGNTHLKGDLDVDGKTTLNDTTVNGKFTVNGEELINGDQTVTGKSTVGSQEVLGDSLIDGNQHIKGNLTVDGISELIGKVTTRDDVEVGKDLLVNGDARIKGNTTMEGDAAVEGDFRVDGYTNLKDTLIDGTLRVTGDATFDEKITAKILEVLGDSTIGGSQNIHENLTVEGESHLNGDVFAGKNLEVNNNFYVNGVSVFKDDVTMEKNLNVQGDTTMDGDLSVAGNTELAKLHVLGESQLDGNTKIGTDTAPANLEVTGNTDIGQDLHVAGKSQLDGDTTIGTEDAPAEFKLYGNSTITGNQEIGENLVVEGTSTLKGDVAMGSNASVANHFHVGGETNLDGNTTIGTEENPADLHVTGNAVIDKNMAVGGDTTLEGNVEIGGDLHATAGTSYFSKSIWNEGQENQVEINNEGVHVGLSDGSQTNIDSKGFYAGGTNFDEANAAMHADGRIKGIYGHIEKDLQVDGKIIGGELDVIGNTNVGGNLNVSGDTNIAGNTNIQKDLTVNGNSNIAGNSYVGGNELVEHDFQVNGNSNFGGNVVMNKNLEVKGNTVIHGGLVADSAIIGGKDLSSELGRLDTRVDTVGANAAAMASLTPMPMDDDTKWNLSAAVGNYHSKTAGAAGIFFRPNDKVMFNVRSTFGASGSDNMVGGGVTVALDKGTSSGVSKSQMINTINAQAQQIVDMQASHQAEIGQLRAQLAAVVQKLNQQEKAIQAVQK